MKCAESEMDCVRYSELENVAVDASFLPPYSSGLAVGKNHMSMSAHPCSGGHPGKDYSPASSASPMA